MASLASDTIHRDGVVEKYEKEAMNIVFSLPELTRGEQTERLANSVINGGSEIALEVAERAIDIARRTF